TRGWEMTSPESGRMLAFDRVNSTYAFTTRENPVSARRAFFPADPEESASGLSGEIRGRSARVFSLGSAGGAVSAGEGASFRVYRRSDAPWELEVSVDNRHSERPEPKVVIPHRKTIDAFRDGEENPDTDLDSGQEDLTDLYRLYLDAGTVNETLPLNVVLVLDYSGSMNPRADDPRRESYYMDGQTRYEVLRDTVCPADRDGIVDLILSDPDNRMSLVTFSWLYEDNTAIAADWTDSAEEIRDVILSGNPAEGTNYDQALRMVSDLLARIPEERKDFPTYVLFMSDGVPTEYVTQNGLPGGYVSPGVAEVSGPGGTYGSVGVETVQNLELVIPATLAAVEDFRERWPKVNISTVAFSNQDMGAVICVPEYIGGEETETCVEMEEGYTYDMVLRNMIQNRGAFYTAANGEELKESFEDMVLASRVTHAAISDELSEYAEIYGEQPDYRVTMKKEGKEEIVLWENGALTEAAAGKLAGVVTDGKKSVLAEFEPDYVLEEDYVYTLSFNIKTTAHAYELFADRISAGQDGYGGVTGDSSPAHERETDYGGNATSTGRPGFHSDEEALFSYSVKGRLYGDPYLHPVVQVSVNTLEIRKVDGQDETKMLSGAAFDLYRRVGGAPEGGTEGIALPGAPPGERYVKVNREPLVTGEDGTAVLAGLVPGTYRIWETAAPEGYRLPGTTWQVILGRHRPEEEEESALVTVSPGETDRTVLLVRNIGKAVLPAAGGPGSGMFFLAGLGAAAAGAALRKFHA
ncbi:MAG: VWA domain-containing protein, partial [Clostridium sp.]|nr:VWA domain-containing protein [Clostridium sp.]